MSPSLSAFPIAADDSERWEATPPGIDKAEIAWWEEYSDVEEEYCWVQTPAIRRFLRKHYIRQIAQGIPRGGRVLEIGCGTGWLSVLLAEFGASEVHGVDASAQQIRRAERIRASSNFPQRLHFHILQAPLAELRERLPEVTFDALVVHGVLHHLTRSEIRQLLLDFCRFLSLARAKVFILEPVYYADLPQHGRFRLSARLIDRLICLPLSGQSLGLRKRSPAELEVQAKIDRRNVGIPPRGPSPKEMPFLPGELEGLIQSEVRVLNTEPVQCFSFHAAKNLLLMKLSHPIVASLIMWPYLWLVRSVERAILASFPRFGSGGHVVFELKECEKRDRSSG